MPTFARLFEETVTPLQELEAQMAESVDALVSNTSRFTPVPVRPRLWVHKKVASLAQLVEHDTLNVGVQGSSP